MTAPQTVSGGVFALRRRWPELDRLEAVDLVGDLQAAFVKPLRRIAPLGLGLIGLRRWYGKRFIAVDGRVDAVNLVRRGDRLVETMPMSVVQGISLADGQVSLVLGYPRDARVPWRWVRDELRQASDGTVVGMTFVDLPGLRALGGLPFLLRRPTS